MLMPRPPLAIIAISLAIQGVAPRFADYPATPFHGRPKPVRVQRGEASAYPDSVLRAHSGEAPNFAGYLSVVQWGCGSPCQTVAFVDVRTGRVLPQTLMTVGGVEYRRDSRLLLADPGRPEAGDPAACGACGRAAYYVWTGSRLEPVGRGPHPHIQQGRSH